MNRETVEHYLQSHGMQFRQMCCVASFSDEGANLEEPGWDDLAKVGAETPWICGKATSTSL
jgi:hypothetical protein